MKLVLIALFVASSLPALCAQPGESADSFPAACGPANVHFKVNVDTGDHPILPPEPGKARVYFIHDAGSTDQPFPAYPTTKFAIDGSWVGADRSNSWFSISIDAGQHHICASLQTSLYQPRIELAPLSAEAGKTYYYRTRLDISRQAELLELEPINSDEARYLLTAYPMSTFTAKK